MRRLLASLFILLVFVQPSAAAPPGRFQQTAARVQYSLKAAADSWLLTARLPQPPSGNAADIPAEPQFPTLTTDIAGLTGDIAFSSDRLDPDLDLFAGPAFTNGSANLLVGGSGADVTPMWSPDGQRLLFASNRDGDYELFVRESSGLETQLTFNDFDDIHPAWSPAGDHIIFAADDSGQFQIYRLSASGGAPQLIAAMPGQNGMHPRYRPDGGQIVYMRASLGSVLCTWNWDIWRMNPDGSNQQRVTTTLTADIYPNWSADGQTILFTSCRNFIDYDIFRIDPATGQETRLTSWLFSNEWGAVESPDGSHIAFASSTDGQDEIYVGSPDGSTASNWTQNSANDWAPSWTDVFSGPVSSISGQVSDSAGGGVGGVTISLNGVPTTTTGPDGQYTLTGLAPGLHIVTAQLQEYALSPPARDVLLPRDSGGQDFRATDCQNANRAKRPVLLAPGWDAAANLADDTTGFAQLVPIMAAEDNYVFGCNLFYAGDTSPTLSLAQNGGIIHGALCDAVNHVRQYAPELASEFVLIGHSYGGLRSRAFLENNNLYDASGENGARCFTPEGSAVAVHVRDLITLGTPHGGGDPRLPGALVIGFQHIINIEDWLSVIELLFGMPIYNATHAQPAGTCYHLVGGNVYDQTLPAWIQFLLSALAPQFEPNDLGVFVSSAHRLAAFDSSYPAVAPIGTHDAHGHIGLPGLHSYVYPNHTYLEELDHILALASVACGDGSHYPTPGPPPPAAAQLLDSGILTGTETVNGSFDLVETGQTILALSLPLGELAWELRDPAGDRHTPVSVAADPNSGYHELELMSTTATYVFTSTLTGTWHYTATATVPYATPYQINAYTPLPVTLELTAPEWIAAGQTVVITGTLRHEMTTPLPGAFVTAQVLRPDGRRDDLTLFDDGAHVDGPAGDGVYGASYSATELAGYYNVVAQAAGSYLGEPFQRSDQALFAAGPATAALAGVYSDAPRDLDGDGYFDWLDISVTIDVVQPGTFLLAADLETDDGTFIGRANQTLQLDGGGQIMRLAFPNEPIHAAGQDGPYLLTHVTLIDTAYGTLTTDMGAAVYWTAAYDHNQFLTPFKIYLPLVRDK